jgi:hypothetical protein
MKICTGIGLVFGWVFVTVPTVLAQNYVIPLPDLTVTGSGVINSPTLTTVTSIAPVPVMTNILGFSLQANWTAGTPPAGDPSAAFSQELKASITPFGVAMSPLGYLAGLADSNPYTFGVGFDSARTIHDLSSPLPTSTAGTLSATFTTASLNGSTANLTNVAVTVFTNPTSLAGTTAGGPQFARPFVDGSGVSTVANNVRYAVQSLTVSQSGTYMLASSTHAGYDGMVFLYQGSFNPNSPLTNYVAGGDEETENTPQNAPSALAATLLAGQTYVVVQTGKNNNDAGTFTVYAAGPGGATLTPVPEPMVILAGTSLIALAGGAVRRFRGRT